MTNALVTGAYGFVGRNVARYLARQGVNVTGLGHGDWPGEDPGDWGIASWQTVDIDVDSLLENAGCPEIIVHCAGSGSVPYSMERPRDDFRRTVDATLAVLDFARLHVPTARIVLPSSAAVYGFVDAMPIGVGAPLNPLSPYGVHKRIAEELCRSYATHFGVKVAIVRLFSVYGSGLRKQLLWDACRKIQAGSPEFGGDGSETRDWLHVDDAASLLMPAAQAASAAWPTVNGGTGRGVSVREVVTRLARQLGGPTPCFSGKIRLGDPRHFEADLAETRALGWAPARPLDQGLDEYARWFIDEAQR